MLETQNTRAQNYTKSIDLLASFQRDAAAAVAQ